ncbi:hypothetical protein AB0B94_30530 [Micromonospora sp. NPDC048986]|uniref:hypothetical protein n=1 Tax=Micromonospora sp. NPDC048986 TaxID=3155644 RepID=UPI0033DF4465
MPNKTFYIPEQDTPLWAAAQRVATRNKVSLYRLLVGALESHLPAVAAEPAPQDRWANIAADQQAA